MDGDHNGGSSILLSPLGETVPAKVTRPKGITTSDWNAYIALLEAYQVADPNEPGYDPEAVAVAISDLAVSLFLEPLP